MQTTTLTADQAASLTPADLAALLSGVIAEHERHAGCYFWSPRSNASARRAAEFTADLDFTVAGRAYSVVQTHRESCTAVYYRLEVSVNGKRSNVTGLRKAVAALQAAAA